MAVQIGFHVVIFTLISLITTAASQCTFPIYIKGDYFAMINGESVTTTIDNTRWGDSTCKDVYNHPKPVESTYGANHTFLLLSAASDCLFCLDVLWRTENVLQFKKGDCLSSLSGITLTVNTSCDAVKSGVLPDSSMVTTMYRTTDTVNINCISTFEGVYQFTYEINVGGGGICDNPESQIVACQDPGSAYVDNQVFRMKWALCKDVATSSNKLIRYQCFGTWFAMSRDGTGYTYAAIADTVEQDKREKFKCLLTNKNQKEAFNKIRWTISRFTDCSGLSTIMQGDIRLVLTRIPPVTPYLTPQCSLPRNLTGMWMTQGVQYVSNIRINETHIYFNTPISQFEYQETFYSCQQSQGTRYLMTKVVVGKCEVDFQCFDITARHHSIVKYRVGKPYQYQTALQLTDSKTFLQQTFRDACSWTTFTYDRDDYVWKYETMILNPPSAVACPIGGRFSFVQTGRTVQEEYSTRIRGVTEKPRNYIACRNWVTEFKSCSNTMSLIGIDAEYCETLDYRGRPISEYDVADNFLMCVGYWMEDMKSFLITWDEEDAISSFRCWVYERKSWTGVYMSRAQNARCPREQDALSYEIPGTGLAMDLTESERLFDDCPQRFDTGANPFVKPIQLWVLSGAATQQPLYMLILAVVVSAVYRSM